MGKKYKKKVQWKQLSLTDIVSTNAEERANGDDCEEEEGDSAPQTPTHEDPQYPRQPYKPNNFNNPRRGSHNHHGYYHANYDRRFDKNFDRYSSEHFRNLENRGPAGGGGGVPFEKPYSNKPFHDRNYHYDKFYARHPFYGERNFKFANGCPGGGGGFMERGRRPFRPYGRPGFFSPRGFPGQFAGGGGGPFRDHPGKGSSYDCEGEDEEEEWDDEEGILMTEVQQHHHQHNGEGGEGVGGIGGGLGGGGSTERPSQPVHTVMINNEEYTKIQTPRQEVIFKKSSLDRKRDSIDQGSVTGSVSSGSGSSSTTGGEPGSGSAGSGDQVPGDGSSVAGSVEDTSLSMTGEDPPDIQQQDQVFEDPNEIFAGEPGGPPLAGVVMQQAYPGGPMITIPVHWTPFIDPTLIPGETALTPLDPAFTHVIDPKSLPIDPLHILPVQHDASGCPVHVQVKVDSNGVPIQIQPTAFTVSLSSLHHQHHDQQGVLNPQDHLRQQDQPNLPHDQLNLSLQHQISTEEEEEGEELEEEGEELEEEGEVLEEEEEDLKEEADKKVAEKGESAEDEIVGDEESLSPDNQTEGRCFSSRKNSEGNEEMVLETCASDEMRVSAEVDTTVDKSLSEKDREVKSNLKENEGENEGVIEEGEVEETDDNKNKMERHCSKNIRKENEDETTTNNESVATSAAVPSTKAEVISSTESHAVNDSSSRGHPTLPEEAEEEEEDDEEEEMLAKESEEGSDSSDSQYASMSESSTTPTTPASEPSDTHEIPESHRVESSQDNQQQSPEISSAEHPEDASLQDVLTRDTTTEELTSCDAKDEASCPANENNTEPSETSGTSPSEQDHPDTISDFTTDQNPNQEATENVLQGYVMVPILTPYYDPSVLYGYPVVVGEQTPQQHQRGYSKRKKKKYQRRRHADVPAAGGYLDPQLYTGEPFVATPGGYVVPVDAASSVCQVHGFQYVTSPFPLHQHPDEGFVQHSSYVPDAVLQQLVGTNQEDGSKTIFSDLQETERRQIQEILQEQRAKVEKSDSTESSDSGVSESEEVVTAELSSDEQETQKNNLENSVSSGNPEDSTKDSIISTQSHKGISELIETEESKNSQGCTTDTNANLNTNAQDVEEIQPNAQSNLPADDLSGNHSPEPPALPHVNDQSNQAADTTDASIHNDDDSLKQRIGNSTQAVYCGDTNAEEEFVNDYGAEKDILTPNTSKHLEEFSKLDSVKTIYTAKELPSTLEDFENSGDSKLNAQFKEGVDDSAIVKSENKPFELLKTSQDNSAPNSEVKSTSSGIYNCSKPICSEAEQVQTHAISSEKHLSHTNVCQSIISSSNEGKRDESIDHDSLQDLRVTEAVKRWIREVTPEKAFSLSEEVQTRLLEQSIEEEMDTEDEYIEDEIPQTAQSTLQNPKNVKSNPFVAASSNAPLVGMEGCSKRVAVLNRQRGTTPDTLDDYDGSSTISNLSYDHLYSEASSSQPASFNQSFEEDDIDKHTENPNIYNPVAYAKYYQLGVEVDDSTPAATPLPQGCQISRETTPAVQTESETVSECGSEDIETIPHKYDVVCQYTATSPMSLATEILKAEKVLSNMSHITGTQQDAEASGISFGNPDIYLKHYETARRVEVGDSGVQSEESSDEMEARSNVGSSGVGSSLASTPAVSPAHRFQGKPPLQPHPLRNLSAGEGPVPCRTVCCAVM